METGYTVRCVLGCGFPFRYPRYLEGLPHAVTCSDIYEGYYIPKGMFYMSMLSVRINECSIRGNHPRKRMVRSSRTWESRKTVIHYSRRAMSRDEARYPDAEKFVPERFLDAEGRLTDDDPGEFIFGFGRRRCAGKPLHCEYTV